MSECSTLTIRDKMTLGFHELLVLAHCLYAQTIIFNEQSFSKMFLEFAYSYARMVVTLEHNEMVGLLYIFSFEFRL